MSNANTAERLELVWKAIGEGTKISGVTDFALQRDALARLDRACLEAWLRELTPVTAWGAMSQDQLVSAVIREAIR